MAADQWLVNRCVASLLALRRLPEALTSQGEQSGIGHFGEIR